MSVEYAPRGLVGLLTPQANTTVEPEFSILMPAGFAHLNARLVSPAATIEARLVEYFAVAAATARQFANAPVRALALACTGASYLAGREREAALLDELCGEFGMPAFTAASAVIDALRMLGARRIALASPYPAALTQASVAYWQSHGLEVKGVASAPTDTTQFHSIYSLGADAAGALLHDLTERADIDAVVMLGTGMPTLAPLLAANARGGVPVLSCMLCLGWKAVDVIEPGAWPLAGWLAGSHWRTQLAAAMPAQHPRPIGLRTTRTKTVASTPERPVLIAGAGPVGLCAALRLGHYGIPCVVLEGAASVPRDLRASTFHPPTLDMLEPYGITARLLAAGLKAPTWQVRWHTTGEFAAFDLGVLAAHTAHPYRLQCEQWKLAEYLLEHIRAKLPHVHVQMGWRVASFSQQADSVRVHAVNADGDEQQCEGAWLIGADGARSVVRSALGFEFEGRTFPETTVLATTTFPFHDHIPDLSHINYCWAEGGTFSLLRLPELWRVSLYPEDGETEEDAAAATSVQAKLQKILPRDHAYEVLQTRSYRIHQRVVKAYVHGRVVLAGDAAHVNSPSGGMGMNGGIHDAFNLADKLHRIATGQGNGAELLQLYERQRRPVALKHVLEQSGRNRARMQERDPARRRAALTELQRKAADPKRAEAYLLETSMFTGLREADAIR